MADPTVRPNLLWVKLNDVSRATFVGNETIAIGYGHDISFININTGKETYYHSTGGVQCLMGHHFFDLFAYAELTMHPNIVILCYDGMEEVGRFRNEDTSRYLSVDFSETEYLIALTGLPNYLLEVWNWRTRTLLAVHDTGLITDYQTIRCSKSLPLTIVQLANRLGKINFWEVYPSVNMVAVIKRKIKIPCDSHLQPFNFTYASDGSIFLCNQIGTVWNIFPSSGKTVSIFKWPDDSGRFPTQISLYRNGLIIGGPNGGVKYFKKIENEWTEQWGITQKYPLSTICTHGQNTLVAITRNGTLVRLNDDCEEPKFDEIRIYDRFVKWFALVNPIGQYAVTVNLFNTINVLDIETGKVISTLEKSVVTCIRSVETLPILGIGNKKGIVYLLSIYDPENPKVLCQFNLTQSEIKFIRFSESGERIVVADVENNIFILQGTYGDKIDVINHIPYDKEIEDLTAHEQEKSFIIIAQIVPAETDELKISRCLRIELKPDRTINLSEPLLSAHYLTISTLNKRHSPNEYIGVPFMTKDLHFLEYRKNLKQQTEELAIKKCVRTPHEINYYEAMPAVDYIFTWGLDGQLTIWDKETMEIERCYRIHNRYAIGIKYATVDIFMDYILTLGNTGNMVCTKTDFQVGAQKRSTVKKEIFNPQLKYKLTVANTDGFVPEGVDRGKTWLQIQEDLEHERETNQYEPRKIEILNALCGLREKLKVLIDSNEEAPDNEKLDIQEFNLDTKHRITELKEAEMEREEEDRNLKTFCAEQQVIIDWIISHTWDKVEIKGRKLRGIFTKLMVPNFPILFKDPANDENLKRVQLWRLSEKLLSEQDAFLPWTPKTTSLLDIQLCHRPGFQESETVPSIGSDTSVQSNEEETKEIRLHENFYSLNGTGSHQFIVPLPIRYKQLDVISYEQMYAEQIMAYHDTLALRIFYNRLFDQMIETKTYNMNLVMQRNDRLRHIQSELNILEQLKGSDYVHDDEIVDPIYYPDEIPQSIVTVQQSEVSIGPYISPSEQRLIDERAAEAERRRLELLADDFRERALMYMMNGVLEIKWEDEIKKSPPQPECVTNGKDPMDYDENDLRTIQEYEQKMAFLNSERDRYHVMLCEERINTQHLLDEQLVFFNLKVGKSLLEKMKIAAAIGEEDLKQLRYELYNFQRYQFAEKRRKILADSKDHREEIDELTTILGNLEEKYLQSKQKYEEMAIRDRALEKHFKQSFSEHAAQAMVDQSYRIFRRRPKWQMRAWHTTSILTEMARRVMVLDQSRAGAPIPEECFTYLRAIEQVEKFTNAPNLMDQNVWQILCKMRRVKIEVEFKTRALCAQMAEAEASFNSMQKEINMRKSKVAQFDKQWDELREQQASEQINRTIQICMKRGIVEVPLSGKISDFENSILLHITDIEEINRIIKRAGDKKLKTMRNAALFRRQIIYKEWEHKGLRMKVEDMQNSIRFIDRCKVTKEVQMWLKWKKLGWVEDLSQAALHREIDAMVTLFQNVYHEIKLKVFETEKEIDVKRRENLILDKKILRLNIDVTELNIKRDVKFEEEEYRRREKKMVTLMERSRLLNKVQMQHAKILELSTMLELQRLRTYPTLALSHYKARKHV